MLHLLVAHTAAVEYATLRLRRAAWGWTRRLVILETEYGPVFGPEDAAQLTAAFEAALSKLGLVDRTDPMTMTVAKLIIQLAKNGERDPQKLCDDALKNLQMSLSIGVGEMINKSWQFT